MYFGQNLKIKERKKKKEKRKSDHAEYKPNITN